MIYLNIEKALFEQINNLLPEIWPNVKIDLLSEDENLERLGFCKSAPCRVSIDLSESEYELLLDKLIELEVDAFNTPDGNSPSENDPKYIRYLRYGWMWDVLYSAEKQFE